MNDQEIRDMIRASIARHTASPVASSFSRTEEVRLTADTTFEKNAAFARLPLLKSGDDDGACVIEPTVRCNHCGYCLSYGH